MKYFLWILVLFLPSVGVARDFYVNPNGDDANNGTREAPFATLAAAKHAARTLVGQEAVTVHVADGIYYLPETLVLTPVDSGTADAPVLYRAENEGRAVLSGGSKLKLEWQPFKDGIFKAETPAGLKIDQLFIDGKNQRMARYPNYDRSKKAQPYQGFAADAFAKERAAKWANPTGGYIHSMHRAGWGGYHYLITGKGADGEVTYEGGWQNNRRMGMHKDHRMVENIFEELDAPGEWFHNAKTRELYYKPEPNIDLSKATVEVVRLRHLVEFQGTEKAPVKFITLQGFAVRHAARTFMDCREPLLRSDWAIYRGGAFMLTGTEDVSIVDCEFDQVGGNAVFVNNYNRRVLVKGCHIHDTGASGVCFVGDPEAVRDPLFEYGQKNDLATIDRTPGPKTDNYPAQSVVEDCLIHGIGRVERQPAGVQIEMASEITVRDCSVYDTARAGINIGDGAWGGHLIERCDVFDTVLETHDHGSFNSWGRDRYWRSDHLTASQKAVDAEPNLPFLDAMKTTVIRDSRWRCDHGWDIDLDDGSSNYDIYNNLLLNKGLKLREGFRRHAWNNVMPIGSLHPHVWFQRSKDQVHTNIMSARHRTARMDEPYADGTMVDRNLYDSQDKGILEFAAKLGWDANSVLGAPAYVDPASGDFRVKQGSPALKLGFKNFPMDQFGVKKPALRAIAKTPRIPSLTEPATRDDRRGASRSPVKLMQTVWLGATLLDLKGEEFSAFGVNKEAGGVVMVAVPNASAAAKAGLKKGDLIQGLQDQPVSNIEQLFTVLSGSSAETVKLRVVRNQQTVELSAKPLSMVIVESAGSESDFARIPVPRSSRRTITTNRRTANDPVDALTDGKLARSFGPVFPNGIHDGAYKMDLGAVNPVTAINSWSVKLSDTRVGQKLTIYGSDSAADPGWDLSAYAALGSIVTGSTKAKFTATSLRATGKKTLGKFRWILWRVFPVSELGGGENTAFQELSVEIDGELLDRSASDSTRRIAPPSAFPGEWSSFRGYDRYDRIKTPAGHFSVVCPKEPAPGKPWLWRSLFWEAIRKVSDADLKLVDEGYHVVLAHGDVAGHPRGNANIDAAYELLTTEYGFSKTCSNMSSMSRGTLSLFRWASANPDKVDSIYVDNGVCNVLSWPAGKLVPGSGSQAAGAPSSWADFKRKFGYATDEDAIKTKESPIDQLEPLAKAGVPILMVCGNKDTAVPYEENDAIMEQRYKTLGGSIKVIVEEKGHSHGMNDPTPVLEFIRTHTSATKTRAFDQADIDYAPSTTPGSQKAGAVLPLDPSRICVVSGNLGAFESDFVNGFMNHMNLWMAVKKPGACRIKWRLQVPADGHYQVDALAAGKGSRMSLTCNGVKQETMAELTSTASLGWDRVSLGTIRLKAGENTLQLDAEAAKGFKLDALEIAQPAVKADLLKDALAMRQKPEWFSNAGYGLMFQWTNRATPPKGPIKPWEEKVNDFDLDGFIQTVEDSGAAYVLWSVTWGNHYISAPIESLDAILKGRTTRRDLLGEISDALHARGIKLIFYYHYGYDCNHSIDADWMEASGGYSPDKTEFYKNWMAIVSEIGERYGEKLHGWWFDGGQRYYNCHFDNTPRDQGILSAPFKDLTLAARSGNRKRIVSYNSWIKPRLTEYQDFYGGEGAHVFKGLDEGSFSDGPQKGLQAHGCFIFEKRWGHIERDMPISKPKYSLKKLTTLVRKAQEERSPLSINLEMYEDGSVSPDSIALLKQLKAAVRANSTDVNASGRQKNQ